MRFPPISRREERIGERAGGQTSPEGDLVGLLKNRIAPPVNVALLALPGIVGQAGSSISIVGGMGSCQFINANGGRWIGCLHL